MRAADLDLNAGLAIWSAIKATAAADEHDYSRALCRTAEALGRRFQQALAEYRTKHHSRPPLLTGPDPHDAALRQLMDLSLGWSNELRQRGIDHAEAAINGRTPPDRIRPTLLLDAAAALIGAEMRLLLTRDGGNLEAD